jgi:hypothetical protein
MSDPSNPPVVTPPLMNDPNSRTTDGTIKDQSTASSTPTEPKPDATVVEPPAKPVESAAKPDTTAGAPEKYEAFTAPDGHTIDATAIDAAIPIFKELNLTQSQSQKLVDFYNTQMIAAAKAPGEAVETMREGWRNEVKADKEIGGIIPQVKADIGKAIATLDPALATEFKLAMDLTGAGDHPAFVKAFWKLSKSVIEGTHVSGGGPSPHGQAKNGVAARPTAAQAMYPNLPSSQS